MNRYLRYTLLGLMWAAVAAYVIWAGASARRVRTGKKVAGVEIEVVDSSSQGHLVSAAMVRGWISHSGIKTLGEAVDAVDLAGVERLIARNGFVDEVGSLRLLRRGHACRHQPAPSPFCGADRRA